MSQETPPNPPPVPGSEYSRKNPFLAELVEHRTLTLMGSGKDTRHFVLGLADSGLTYTPGDSLGVYARNDPALVAGVLKRTGLDPSQSVRGRDGTEVPLHQALEQDVTLNRAGKKILTAILEKLSDPSQRERLQSLLGDTIATHEYLFTRDYIDILQEFDQVRFESGQEFITQLTPLQPRLYSIASSLAAHPGEVHLCVAIVRYETHGRKRTGLCTGYLADRVELHRREIPVYVQVTKSFRLPEDPARHIIMVGPGTGIAPFRAFLEQRALDGAAGRNWLFFGEQHQATDFLYQEDLERLRREGVLHRLDLAFSRDQDHKIYVQHRMREEGADIWAWLQEGAYFYVCGDARRMAKDVHQSLIEIARDHGGLSEESARHYVEKTLAKDEKRYLKDVY